MLRNSYPTIQAAARRCLIRSSPTAPVVEQATRRISIVPSCSSSSVGSSTNSNSHNLAWFSLWTPPELRLSPQEQRTAAKQYQQQQQQQPSFQALHESRRTFVWHAGQMEAAEVSELERTIEAQMSLLAQLIQQLPQQQQQYQSNTGRSCDDNNTTQSCVEQILQQETIILNLCQDYQRLTGDEYEALPQPYCDESSTVLQMCTRA